jgi:hypothetical protein
MRTRKQKLNCGTATVLTAPNSNWRGRGNIKFCIFKKPFVVVDS